MKTIFICLFTIVSIALHAQTPTLLSDSTRTPVKLDCLGDKPLYVVDSKIIPCDSVRFINSDDIYEFRILKDTTSVLSGFAGRQNETIIITTKEYATLQKGNKSNEIKKPHD